MNRDSFVQFVRARIRTVHTRAASKPRLQRRLSWELFVLEYPGTSERKVLEYSIKETWAKISDSSAEGKYYA